MAKIQVKRGLQAAVTNVVLADGELAVALDTGNVYVGTPSGKIHINPSAADVPTKVSQLANDSNYQTLSQVNALISALVASAPETLNTLKELAVALNNDPNFATTITNSLAKKEGLIKSATSKSTLVDNDTIPLSDSAASNATKKITYAQLKAVLKAYTDTLYNKYSLPTASTNTLGGIKVGNGLSVSNGVVSIGNIDGGTF